jgi:hypothetical protein
MPIEADILLAQAAQGVNGSVSALGLGWQVRPPGPIPWAVVVILRASRDLIGISQTFTVKLEKDGSGTDELENEVEFEIEFTPEGLTGDALSSPVVRGFSFNLPPIPLEPGTEFCFRLWVGQETRDHWAAPFRTTPP